jgi:curved DNA-binding protein CbpA
MAFKLEQGLFGLDFTDHHAVLGVPINADIKEVRKRYLKIARRLHPDSSALKDIKDRQRANELLSKLVNPSYEFLSQEKNLAEHHIMLKLKGEQAQRQQETIVLSSDTARRLASAPNPDQLYISALLELAQTQYEALDRTLSIITQISELNLVYLMRKGSTGVASGPLSGASKSASSAPAPTSAPPPAGTSPTAKKTASPSRDELIDSFIRRSEEFEKKRDYPRVILELREALKINPTSAVCHSRLGMVYLKTKQPKMAKIHFMKALELDPKNEVAQVGLRSLDPKGTSATSPSAGQPSKAAPGKSASGKSAPKSGGGLFGLFGNKRK